MGTVGLVFAPLAPLVAVAACVVYWVSSLVYKYQLMFVFVSRVETGGVSTSPDILSFDSATLLRRLDGCSVFGMLSSIVFSCLLCLCSCSWYSVRTVALHSNSRSESETETFVVGSYWSPIRLHILLLGLYRSPNLHHLHLQNLPHPYLQPRLPVLRPNRRRTPGCTRAFATCG